MYEQKRHEMGGVRGKLKDCLILAKDLRLDATKTKISTISIWSILDLEKSWVG